MSENYIRDLVELGRGQGSSNEYATEAQLLAAMPSNSQLATALDTGNLFYYVPGFGWTGPIASPSGAAAGTWVYIYDVTGRNGAVVSDKTYQDVGNNVIQSYQTSGNDITLRVRASHPLVQIGITPFQLTKVGDIFEGDIDQTLLADGDIAVQVFDGDGAAGGSDTVSGTISAPPQLLTFEFTGGYPGGQTELKAGDTFQLTGTLDKAADAIEVQDFEASDSVQLLTFPSGTNFTVTMTIGDRGTSTQALAARARPRDASSGAFGPNVDTDAGGAVNGVNTVQLNNTFPGLSIGAITYPASQGALKGSESATVVNSATNFDIISYTDPTGTDLTITNPATFETPKTVTRAGGTVNVSSPNFRITATRSANGAVTTAQSTVFIVNVAPTITVGLPAARLQSGGNNGTSPVNHTITLTSDQPLLSTPTLNADSGGNRGTFLGSWSGGPAVYTRSLQVNETTPDEKGTFTFEGLVATGLSGLVQNTISAGASYTLGGFVARDLVFAPFATTTSLGTSVEDFSKLTATLFTATAGTPLKQSIGTSPPVTNGYTIDATATNPTTVIWLDTTAASSNSTGTAEIQGVEETP